MPVAKPDSAMGQRIFDAAVVVFGRYGFRRASMEAVAAEAHISRQGLYRHFASKEMLFAAVIERMHGEVEQAGEDALAAARAAKQDSGAAIGAMMGAKMASFAERMAGSAHAAELMEESTRIGGPIIAAKMEASRAGLTKVIAAERSAGRLTLKRGITPAELAQLVTTAANGAKYGGMPGDPVALRALVARIVTLIVDGARA